MEKFDKINFLKLRKMTLKEVENYYLLLRKYEYENQIPINHIELRKKIHNILVKVVELDRKLSKEQVEIIYDKSDTNEKKIIYACTHIGGNDAQVILEMLPTHAYLFIADLREMYRDITGILLRLNGAICLETNDKEDRKIAKERAIEVINNGANLLIFPEGAWNITPNLPVMDLYKGTADIAIQTNSEIVPVAIEQYENKYYITIGKNIKIDCDNPVELTRKLRDELAKLKFDIWEFYGLTKRSEIANLSIEEFQNKIIDKCPYGFTLNDIIQTRYNDKNKVTVDEVFEPIKKLKSPKN